MNKQSTSILTFLCIAGMAASSFAQTAQECIVPTPPMGWNTWNYFGENINEEVIRKTADAMVSSGLRDAGYQYIVIDDSWEYGRVDRNTNTDILKGRDANGKILVDTKKFPSGMKALADYVHAKGLKFGIYTSPGIATCMGCTGSVGHEAIDVATFAEWGVDFIKLDGCFATEPHPVILKKWRNAIDSIGRPMVLSTNLGAGYEKFRKYADMWRTTADIGAIWKFGDNALRTTEDIYGIIQQQIGNEPLHGNCAWNDPDMLQVGNGGLTYNENKCHFALWAVLGAPLILGNNLYEMKDEIRDLLANPEILAINQDAAGTMGTLVKDYGNGVQIWVKQLWRTGDEAIAFLNASEQETTITVQLSELGITGEAWFRDACTRSDIGLFSGSFTVNLPKNDILLAKVSAFEKLKPLQTVRASRLNDDGVVTRIEAEASDFYVSQIFSTGQNDFSGRGYLKNEPHDWAFYRCIWKYSVGKPCRIKATVRYMNNTGNSQKVKINDNEATEYRFEIPAAPIKGKWQTCSFEMQSTEGNNHIKFELVDQKVGEVLIDCIDLEIIK